MYKSDACLTYIQAKIPENVTIKECLGHSTLDSWLGWEQANQDINIE